MSIIQRQIEKSLKPIGDRLEQLIQAAQTENIKKMDKNIEDIKASIDRIVELKVEAKFKELMATEQRRSRISS